MHLHVLSYMVHVISSASKYVARAHEYLDMLTCLFHTQTSPMHARILTCASMHGNSVKVGRDRVLLIRGGTILGCGLWMRRLLAGREGVRPALIVTDITLCPSG